MSARANAANSQAAISTMAITQDLTCLDASTNAKGQKTAAIVRKGQPAWWTFASPVVPLFQPSAYQGVVTTPDASQRLTLCLSAQPDVMAEAEALDEWGVQYAVENSEKLFSKKLTLEQVKDRYTPIVKKTEKYPPYLKIKVASDRNDRNSPSYWGKNKQKREAPDNWQRCSIQCHCRIVGFWFMGSTSFGISVQLSDAITDETESSCPF